MRFLRAICIWRRKVAGKLCARHLYDEGLSHRYSQRWRFWWEMGRRLGVRGDE